MTKTEKYQVDNYEDPVLEIAVNVICTEKRNPKNDKGFGKHETIKRIIVTNAADNRILGNFKWCNAPGRYIHQIKKCWRGDFLLEELTSEERVVIA